MIARIRGQLVRRTPEQVVVDVQGVGYRLLIPLSTFYQLPEEGAAVCLDTYTCVREDALLLYGFLTLEEKLLFEKLITVNKVGPKLAISLLSGLPADELKRAIARQDVVRLSSIPGIGLKTAERIVLELRDKMPPGEEAGAGIPSQNAAEAAVTEDVLAALVNLGYRRKDAEKAVKKAWQSGERSIEGLIRRSLTHLAPG